MVGGKWTTFRSFAEQTADIVLKELGRKRVCDTIGLAIGGGAGFPKNASDLEAELVARHGISVERAAWLVDAYGTRAREALGFCLGRDDDVPLDGAGVLTGAEIAFLCRTEFVVGLEDMLLRRTPLSIRGDVSSATITAVAGIMATELGWTPERKAREIETFIRDLADYHGVSREALERRTRDRSDVCA
jgi:glycerol-3-phosphate dehydrogenase